MDYAQASVKWFAFLRENGLRESVSLNELALAKAMDAVDPGQLELSGNGSALKHRGVLLAATHAALAPLLRMPGFRFAMYVEQADWSMRVPVSSAPPADPLSRMGPLNRAFAASLRKLTRDRLAPLGIVPTDKLLAVLDAGVVAMPASAGKIKVVAPFTALDQLAPVDLVESWNAIVAEFDSAWSGFLARQLEAGQRAIEDSHAAIARWEAIERAVMAVRDLPQTVVATAVKGVGMGIAGLGLGNWAVLAAIGVGYMLWLNRAAVAPVAGKLAGRGFARLVGR